MNSILQTTLVLLLLSPWAAASADDDEAPTPDITVEDAASSPPEGAAPEEEKTPRLVERAREIIAQISQKRARIQNLAEEAVNQEGEDLEVLNRQLAEAKLESLERIDDLVLNLRAQEKKGLDGAEAREVLEFNLLRLGPSIVEHLDAALEKVSSLRRQRAETDLAELPALEQEIAREVAWLESLYAAYTNQLRHMAALHLEHDALARDLARRLANRADRLLG